LRIEERAEWLMWFDIVISRIIIGPIVRLEESFHGNYARIFTEMHVKQEEAKDA
jgi:hypothetical protein